MPAITTRIGKGSTLTHSEMDANLTTLNTLLEAGGVTTSAPTTPFLLPTGTSMAVVGSYFVDTDITLNGSLGII
jgi:hypothetical protein